MPKFLSGALWALGALAVGELAKPHAEVSNLEVIYYRILANSIQPETA